LVVLLLALTHSRANLDDLDLTARVLALARSRGLPVPEYELTVRLDDGNAIVQERLPGVTHKRIDIAQLDAMLALNERSGPVRSRTSSRSTGSRPGSGAIVGDNQTSRS